MSRLLLINTVLIERLIFPYEISFSRDKLEHKKYSDPILKS